MNRFYFDYNATTPLAPAVADVLKEAVERDWRNPSSSHKEGREAHREMEKAREQMARLLDCEPSEIIFTGGATEANNLVFHSVWNTRSNLRNKIITTTVEHDAVLQPLARLKNLGAEIVKIPVSRQGALDVKALQACLNDRTLLVSLMMANNETGIFFPVGEVCRLVQNQGIFFHTDAACVVGKIPLSFKKLGVDFLSLSGHKFHAPKGTGVLVVRRGIAVDPLLVGGAQEAGRRAGTENIFGIMGMASALEFSLKNTEDEIRKQKVLSLRIKEELKKHWPPVFFNEAPLGLISTISATFPGLDNQMLMARLDLEGVAVSTGSACHSGAVEASHVLLAMGLSKKEALETIRLSFGRMTTKEDVEGMLKIFGRVLGEMG